MNGVIFRAADAGDKGRIIRDWYETTKEEKVAKILKNGEWWDVLARRVDMMFDSPAFEFVVACPDDDADTVLAWAIFEDEAVHFAFVRESLRGKRLIVALVGKRAVRYYTNITAKVQADRTPLKFFPRYISRRRQDEIERSRVSRCPPKPPWNAHAADIPERPDQGD